MRVGTRVITADFGNGRVVKLTRTGAIIELDAPSGMQVEVALTDLMEQETAPAPFPADAAEQDDGRPPTVHETPSTEAAAEGFAARRAVEALRFGLVPAHGLAGLTLGYVPFREWLLPYFPQGKSGRPQVGEIVGPFGTGKSHAMAVIRHIAAELGYATARVEVDGQTVSLSDPARLLYSLWSTLYADGLLTSTPMLGLYMKAIEAGRTAPAVAQPGTEDRVRHNYNMVAWLAQRNLTDKYADRVEALLTCSPEITASELNSEINSEPQVSRFESTFKPLLGRSISERPNDFIEVMAGTAAVARLAGYQGLVITIDEFEVEQHNLTAEKRRRVRDLLHKLTKYLKGDTRHPDAPLSIFFATVGTEGHRGDEFIDDVIEATDGGYWSLKVRGEADRLLLAARIHRLYCAAYGVDEAFDAALVASLERELAEFEYSGSGLVRAFIKQYVSLLDTKYGPPAGGRA